MDPNTPSMPIPPMSSLPLPLPLPLPPSLSLPLSLSLPSQQHQTLGSEAGELPAMPLSLLGETRLELTTINLGPSPPSALAMGTSLFMADEPTDQKLQQRGRRRGATGEPLSRRGGRGGDEEPTEEKREPLTIHLPPSRREDREAGVAAAAAGTRRLLSPVGLADCADERGIDYSSVSVGEFAAAMLRGMGVTEPASLASSGAPFVALPNLGRLGLGAPPPDPSQQQQSSEDPLPKRQRS